VCLPPATLIFGAYLWQLCTSWITVHLQSSGSHFLENYREDKAFALVSEVEKSSPPKTGKMWLGLGLLIAMIATQVCVWRSGFECLFRDSATADMDGCHPNITFQRAKLAQ
jgi:hypothetical protein